MTTPRRDPYELLIQQFLQNVQQGSQAVERRFQGQREERLIGEERDFQTGLIEDQRANEAAVRAEEREYDTLVRAEERRNEEADYARERADAVTDANRRWVEGIQLMDMQAAREDTVAARERSNRLRDQAYTYRVNEAQTLRQALAFLDPNSEEFARAERVLNRMMEPISDAIPGDQALQNALSGFVELEDGERVNFHSLIGEYSYLVREAEADEAIRDATRAAILEHLGNPLLTPEQRTAYYNNYVAPNDLLFNDDTRRYALSLIGINDPDAQADALAARKLVQAQTASLEASTALTRVQTTREWLNLAEDQKLAPLRYEEAQLALKERRQNIRSSDIEIFMETGILPSDAAEADQLAASMGMTREQLEAQGRARFKRIGLMEEAALRIEQSRETLLRTQIDGQKTANLISRLQYDNSVLYDAIRNKAELAEVAYAFAVTGNTDGLRVLQSLSLLEEYDEVLGGIEFDGLITIADDVRLSDEEQRAHDRLTRNLDAGDQVIAYQTNRAAFMETIATTFLSSDFTVEDGEFTKLIEDIQEYVGNFSTNELRAMGTDADQLTQEITRAVMRAKALEDRGEAIGAMEALINAAPVAGPQTDEDGRPIGPVTGGLTEEQQNWKNLFLAQAAMADVDLEVAEQIADGVLRTGNFDYFTAMLDAEYIQSQIDANLASAAANRANAARTNFETDLLREAQDAEGVMLDSDMYSDMRLGIESMMDSIKTRLDSAYCTVAAAAGGNELSEDNREECIGLVADLEFYEYELRNLTHAYATQSPYSYGAFIGSMATPVVRSAEAAATMEDWNIRTDLLDQVEEGAPQVIAGLYEDVADGIIDSEADFNAVLAEAASRLNAEARAAYAEEASIDTIDFESREWRDQSDAAKLARLARAPEWRNLAIEVANGREITYTEEESLARQFGWTTQGIVLGRWAPAWLEGPGLADIEGFRRALDITVQQINEMGDLTGAESMGVPGGPAIINGEVNPALMAAVVQAESLGSHRGGGVAKSPEDLTESKDGALGITQVMPLTALDPGFGVTSLIPEADRPEVQRLYTLALETGSQQDYDAVITKIKEVLNDVPEAEFLRFGREYLTALLDYYDGDVERALAAYNAGYRNIDNAIKLDPSNWLQVLDQITGDRAVETQRYVPAILATFNRQTE